MRNETDHNGLKRELSFTSAFLLVVASMIGTGIFTTSGFIIEQLGNPLAMLLCWACGGVFALSGALCYGELGAMFPRAGGEYAFMRESFGSGLAFLSGWVSLIVGFSAPIAAAAIAFATYFLHLFPASSILNISHPLVHFKALTISASTILAVAIIAILSLVHCHSIFLGSKVQNGLTIAKVLLILGFVGAGLWSGQGSAAHLSQSLDFSAVLSSEFALSLIFISFAYAGWNAATYVGAEVKNPAKNIPFSLFCGTFVVTCLYLLLNLTYVYALPGEEMSGVIEVAADAAVSLFGEGVSRLFSAAVAICLLSVIGAMILTGPRVYFAMARDGVFFKLLGRLSAKKGTPVYSILLQAVLAILMVVTAAFDALLFYIGFTLSLFAMLTVVGMVWLRISQPTLERRYKTFGYPLTPTIFTLGNAWIIYVSIKSKPIVSLFGLATIGTGALAYLYFSRHYQGKQSCH